MRLDLRSLISGLWLCLLFASPCAAQTYLGDGNGTSGLGGSCCNWAAQLDASGKSCPAEEIAAHPTCQVITAGQYAAFVSASVATIKTSKSVTVSGGVPSLGTCNGGTLAAGSTDGQGAITFSGASIATTCALVFGQPYSGPGCTGGASASSAIGFATTSTGFTAKLGAALPNGSLVYQCPQ